MAKGVKGVTEMSDKKDKPRSNMDFRIMSLFFTIKDVFRNPIKLLEKVDIKEGQFVLDFGCGPGSYVIPTARIVGEKGRIYALDIHPLAVKTVEKKVRKLGLANVTTILSDRDTGLPEESIDVVLLYDAIQAITDKEELLKELHRVTKPNGLLSILVDHIKVEDVVDIAEKDGLFSIRDRHGKLLNFVKKKI
jgi:ubiquinone/menaquinone biosynthesis C-methylase UbiE